MTLTGTCPTCGAKAPLDAYLLDAEARRAFDLLCRRLAAHPEVVRRVPAYLALHGRPGRATAWPKVTRLIGELAELVTCAAVTWEGAARAATPELWALAMDEALDARAAGTLSVPLDGHGWLRKVAWTKAGQAEARAEAARLSAARGETPIGYSAAHATSRLTPPEAAARDDLQELISDLRALQRLEAAKPGQHAERIAKLQARLAELTAREPTPTPDQDPTHV
jgi:inorganic triphosphatase YgiF